MKPPVCIGVHAIFADNAYENLKASGVEMIIMSNTINHPSNGINIEEIISAAAAEMQ